MNKVARIFVRAPNWVGDMAMAFPALARIRQAYPDAHITCGLRPYLRTLLSNTPYVDDYLEMPRARGLGAWSIFWRQVRAVRRGSFDLAIVMPNSLATGWIVRLAGVPVRLGYKQGRPLTMTDGLVAQRNRGVFARRRGPRRVPKPMPEYYGDLLDVLDLPSAPPPPHLHTSEEERTWIDEWLTRQSIDPGRELVLCNPGSSFGPSKLWVAEHWAELARHYKQSGVEPIFLAGPNEVEMVDGIAAMAGAVAVTKPVIPLNMLKALIERARLVISTDTGPRHLAVGMRVPTVCLMGPNDRRYTDYALERQVVIQKDLPCVPCQRKVCPLGHQKCMRDITVAEVIEAGSTLT